MDVNIYMSVCVCVYFQGDSTGKESVDHAPVASPPGRREVSATV